VAPRCSDQLKDSSVTHATVEVAMAVLFKVAFMYFLHRFTPTLNKVRQPSAW